MKSITLSQNKLLSSITIILASVALLILAGQISIPLKPIPLSFQSASVILLGLTLNARQISISILTYLFLGIIGLPVFANFASGLPIGPSGGYLLGFLPGALLAHFSMRYLPKNIFTYFIAAVLGSSIIFFCGVTQLSHFIGITMAIKFGLMPFILAELIKLMIVAALANKTQA